MKKLNFCAGGEYLVGLSLLPEMTGDMAAGVARALGAMEAG